MLVNYFKYLVQQVDFLKMNEHFKESSIDLVIEKAGLDSIATKETEDVPYILKNVFNQIYSILKPGGILLSFNYFSILYKTIRHLII